MASSGKKNKASQTQPAQTGKNASSQSFFDKFLHFGHADLPKSPNLKTVIQFYDLPPFPNSKVPCFICIDTNVLLYLCRFPAETIGKFFEALKKHHVFLSPYMVYEFLRHVKSESVKKNLEGYIKRARESKSIFQSILIHHFPEDKELISKLGALEKQLTDTLSDIPKNTQLVKLWVIEQLQRQNENDQQSDFEDPKEEKLLIDKYHSRAQEKLPPGNMDFSKKNDSHIDYLIWVGFLKFISQCPDSASSTTPLETASSKPSPVASSSTPPPEPTFAILLSNDQKELKDLASEEWLKWECFVHTSKALHIYTIERFFEFFVLHEGTETEELSKEFSERVKEVPIESQFCLGCQGSQGSQCSQRISSPLDPQGISSPLGPQGIAGPDHPHRLPLLPMGLTGPGPLPEPDIYYRFLDNHNLR